MEAYANTMADFSGKVALITGGSGGIGEALGRALASAGARVALAARRQEVAEGIAGEIRAAGGDALALRCDVREPEQVAAMVRATTERYGGLDILVANAGFGYRKPIIEGDVARWKAMIDTNIFGVLLTLKYGVPPLLARGGGDVLLLSSIAGHVVSDGGAAYSATKFAVRAIGEALRREVTRQGVRVTQLSPGVVISGFQATAEYPPGIVEQWLAGTPPIQVDEIARVALDALALPRHIAINDIIVRPTGQIAP